MARYLMVPPALSTKLPGVLEMQWASIEFSDSSSNDATSPLAPSLISPEVTPQTLSNAHAPQ